jgi:hypothetical protein
MLKLCVGGGLFVAEAAVSGFSISGNLNPGTLWVTLALSVVGAIPLIDQWANALMTGEIDAPAENRAAS